jgi:hypothetical protein
MCSAKIEKSGVRFILWCSGLQHSVTSSGFKLEAKTHLPDDTVPYSQILYTVRGTVAQESDTVL